ncbi:MAG: amino-acid N-acetyltransferase [Spirochaetaceae bacterium]|nr:amino-acid N-acetyltransferase [Spirochaetaceae bacterium]
MNKINLIREVFSYQSRFEGSTMVFKIDSSLSREGAFSQLMQDIALLAKTGFKIVIVPSAKDTIDKMLAQYGIESRYAEGLRITTAEAMPFVEMAAFHNAARFMNALAAGSPLRNGRVDALIGTFVRARGLGVRKGIDMERSGAVEKIITEGLERVLTLGMIPIIPCIGWSAGGKSYNVPSDEIALATTKALGAAKLFIISGKDNIVKGMFTAKEAEALLKNHTAVEPVETSFSNDIQLAIEANKAGVERVHIIDGREGGAVLGELFSNQGTGAMIYSDEYEAIRPMKEDDIPAVLQLMEPLVESGNLIKRTFKDINEKIDDYWVYEIDGVLHASGALHDRSDGEAAAAKQAEIAAIATDPAYSEKGLGKRMVGKLIEVAKQQGFKRVFVLTTVTHDWFEYLGFKAAPVESLPREKRENYNYNRGSKVFSLDINPSPNPSQREGSESIK